MGADRAAVSRTTAYRYFTNRASSRPRSTPEIEAPRLLEGDASSDPRSVSTSSSSASPDRYLRTKRSLRAQLRISLEAGHHAADVPFRTGPRDRLVEEPSARPATAHRNGGPTSRARHPRSQRHRSAGLANRRRRPRSRRGHRAHARLGARPRSRGACAAAGPVARIRPGAQPRGGPVDEMIRRCVQGLTTVAGMVRGFTAGTLLVLAALMMPAFAAAHGAAHGELSAADQHRPAEPHRRAGPDARAPRPRCDARAQQPAGNGPAVGARRGDRASSDAGRAFLPRPCSRSSRPCCPTARSLMWTPSETTPPSLPLTTPSTRAAV